MEKRNSILKKVLVSWILISLFFMFSLGAVNATSYGPQIETGQYIISRSLVEREIEIGNLFTEKISINNLGNTQSRVSFSVTGGVSEIVRLDSEGIIIEPNEETTFEFVIMGSEIGEYSGEMEITGDITETIPIDIEVVGDEIKPLFLIDSKPNKEEFLTNEDLKFTLTINRLKPIDVENVSFTFRLLGENNFSHVLGEENMDIVSSIQRIKEFEMPEEIEDGQYTLETEAISKGDTLISRSILEIKIPFLYRELFGFLPIWVLILSVLFLILLGAAIYLFRRYRMKKKKYKMELDKSQLPKKSQESFSLGKVAETNISAYLAPKNLKTHTIVAGATGGGKSISAQVIIEEALMKDTAVIVFDPTAQWSGMLRKCEDKGMLSHYPKFGLKKSDAKAFKGNVRQVTDAREIIEVEKYINPGEIQIFTLDKLDPNDIDMFVANVIRQVFRSDPQESQELKLILVFDEVHRLLSKFGGSGEGFIQIERACREFRKWGIGVMLVSQVLSDFVGEIKANISTEIQMGTRDEGDLKRIKDKYGEMFLQSLVKASVGVGMFINPEYNHANPYFINFRPILHNTKRLSDEELEKYNQYNEIVDNLEFQIEQLEKEKVDVFDLKTELKLVKDKVMTGNFSVVEVYLESLKPRMEKQWKKIGKKPKKLEKKLADVKEIKESVKEAKEARKKYEKEQEGKEKKEEKPEKKEPVEDKQLKPLTFNNGMMVSSIKELKGALPSIGDEVLEEHVNDEKNDIADWLGQISKEDAKKIESVTDKKEIMSKLDEFVKTQEGGGKEKKESKKTTKKGSKDKGKEKQKSKKTTQKKKKK